MVKQHCPNFKIITAISAVSGFCQIFTVFSLLRTSLKSSVFDFICLFCQLSLETGATKLPKLSRKRRAFQEPCLSFHHETVRIIYSHKCYRNNFQIHNGYFLFHVTLKHYMGDLKTIKGQLFRLYTFDPIPYSLMTAAVQGCSKEKFENFPAASLVLRLS